ncbi:MAG: PEP-CTERM sorting domain-containing protein [Puniceicoccales bacterium]|jgi:hypothetical protein|nr:PEP-CTERM sorting domain-containing protein [Puniceicoccales bacterium]
MKKRISFRRLASLVFLLSAFDCSSYLSAGVYQEDLSVGISESVNGSDNVYISYEGGILAPTSGDALSVSGDGGSSGSIFIGYGQDSSIFPLVGTIQSSSKGINVNSSGSGDIFVQNNSTIVTSSNAVSLLGNNDILLNNSGNLTSSTATAVYSDVFGNGNISIINNADVTSASGDGMSLITAGGNISVTNSQNITGTNEGIYASSTHGNIIINNSGTIRAGGGYALFLSTGVDGSVDVTNTGHIEGASSSSGIYVASSVVGGRIVNTGSINVNEAVNIEGSNVRLELGQGSTITGRIFIAGSHGNVISTGAISHSIDGAVFMSNSGLEIVLKSQQEYGSIHTTQYTDINGATLVLDTTNALVAVGDFFTIMQSDSAISGVFSGLTDGSIITTGDNDEYEFKIHYSSNQVSLEALTAIPEPSTYALGSAGMLGLLGLIRRRSRK